MSGGQGGANKGGPMAGMDEAGIKAMMEAMEAVKKDPAMAKQMEGMWKMMDDMHESDPEEYRKFIEKNKNEMNEDHQQTKK
jgi:hypothetical protein